MRIPPGPKYSWKKALSLLLLSVVPLAAVAALLSWHRYVDRQNCIVGIMQTTRGPILETTFLAEVLGLSVDEPTCLAQFDLKEGKKQLLATHLIYEATLKKIKPNLLWIDYQLRTPLAYLADYTHTGIDAEGVFFPLLPPFRPQNLPKVYLGTLAPQQPWGKRLTEKEQRWLQQLCQGGDVLQFDLSHSEDASLGSREIIVQFATRDYVRLPLKNFDSALAHYHHLRQTMIQKPAVVDVRLPEIAYIRPLD